MTTPPAGRILRDKSHAPCPSCRAYDLFNHANTLPDGTVVDYVHRCEVCGRKSRVTGTTGASLTGDQLRRPRSPEKWRLPRPSGSASAGA
jgi:hypothetical protein